MPRYIIERESPGAGDLSPDELQGISQTSCGVLKNMGPEIQWIRSFVCDDKIYCEYLAKDEEQIAEHAATGGFPANSIKRVASVIDPTTAE